MQRRLRIEPPRGKRTPGGPLHLRVESRLIPLVERPRRPRAKRDRQDRGEAEHRMDMPRRREQPAQRREHDERSEEHTSELQSLMRISYAVFCLKKKKATQREEHRLIAKQRQRDT